MAQFRKKPVVVDAWQWLFSAEHHAKPEWLEKPLWQWPDTGGVAFVPEHVLGPRICIATREGVMAALPGDWIIRGVQGELYPCKPDIFEATYEPVDDAEPMPAQTAHLLEALEGMVAQHCTAADRTLDSMAISTNAEAMELLAELRALADILTAMWRLKRDPGWPHTTEGHTKDA